MNYFDFLPDEMLLSILYYCDPRSLARLCCVCKRFNNIIYTILDEKSNHLLVTNQKSERFRKKCAPLLSSYTSKFNIYYNWKNKQYTSRIKVSSVSYFSLQITEHYVVCATDNYMVAYTRTKDGAINKVISRFCDSNIMNIFHWNNIIITCHSNYDIGHWKIDFEDEYKYPIVELKMYSNDYSIAAIDVTSQYIISGSRNSSIKIRKYLHEGDVEREEEIIDTKIYDARTISIDPTGTLFIANIDKTFSTFDDIPNQNEIVFFDISKNVEIIRRNIDINYLDTKWQNPQSILMLDNNCIKKMDTRTSEFVQTWNNSMAGRVKSRYHVYNAYFTCFSSDDSYTIITGHSDGAIILWDQRQNNPVQMYENFTCVNAVQFDSSHMFVASDRGLHEVIFI
ncbi:F-box/WD repeat-containing protein 4-like isoform X2 [Linepithema humile]|uniref:F-box/WD repeat-containing protein 4-like isoform X2 n=1 Tax=Linepithema humile TaxID=83485 RepID=UPI000623B916|nr:PREDICTED: uncharacterized protein LOC105673997 [Linepithema humile]